MNAPIAPAAVAAAAFQDIELKQISLSETLMQMQRRATLNKEAIKLLTENVKQVGVMQPVLVRPKDKGFELVAGERRFLAATGAGLKSIPAMVRQLTDVQALELQVIENHQREDQHPLIEAQGFDELIKKHHYTVDQIADKIGMSRRLVFNRLKLLDLCPEIRGDFLAGKVNASIAILLARIPVVDLQKRAMKEVTEGRYKGDEPMSYRQASDHLQRNYMLRLDQAPFPVADEKLLAKAGACGACPKRTGNQKDLFPDVGNADVCTDPVCFQAKRAANMERVRKDAELKGQEVVTGPAAKKLYPYSHQARPQGYVIKDDYCTEAPGAAIKYGDLLKKLGKDAPLPTLVQNEERGVFVECYPGTELHKLLKMHGIIKPKKKVKSSSSKTNRGSAVPKVDLDELVQQRIFMTAREKFDGLQQEELAALAFSAAWHGDFDQDVLQKLWGIKWEYNAMQKRIMSMSVADVSKLLFDIAFLEAMMANYAPSKALIASAAKRVKLDPAKVKETIKAELKKKAEDDKAAAKAAPAAKKAKKS
jgi:ParB/RepB/Spo0J family partition protein